MSKNSIPLGKLFGVSLRLHYSWFIIFPLITWTLAAIYFRLPIQNGRWR